MPADSMTRTKVAQRRAAVIRAAAAGFTPEQIVQTVDGVTSVRMAASDLQRGLADAMVLGQLNRDELRELELHHLASVQRAVEGVMRRAAADPGKGDDLVLRAANQLLRVAGMRLALRGLDKMPAAEAPEDELAVRRARMAARRSVAR